MDWESGQRLAIESDGDFTPIGSTNRDTSDALDFDTNSLDDCRTLTPEEWQCFGITPKSRLLERLLEESDVDLDATDTNGRTPLSLAAGKGSNWTVKRLLKRPEVNPDKADRDGRTPLFWSVKNRREETVQQLLKDGGVSPDIPDRFGRTPLLQAVANGDHAIAKLLLEQNGVNANQKDQNGYTLLMYALVRLNNPESEWSKWVSRRSFTKVVELLLSCENVDPNSLDSDGHTPLSQAAKRGYESIVELLLQHHAIEPNYQDHDGRTQLSWAAERGQEAIIQALLRHNHIDPELADKHGRTPLFWAVEQGGIGATQLLLGSGVNPNSLDEEGRTPLSRAAECGQAIIVHALLEHEGTKPDLRDKSGRTPLSWAVCCAKDSKPEWKEGTLLGNSVELLLKQRAVDLNAEDGNGRAPLWWAVHVGNVGNVKLLLKKHDIDPCPVDHEGETPLLCAVKMGYTEIVRLLLPKDDTTLHLQVRKGNLALVTSLVKSGCNVNIEDALNQTPLHIAASNRQLEVARRLILSRANIDPKDINGMTPLQLAIRDKHLDLVELLLESGAPIEGIMAAHWRTTYESRTSYSLSSILELLEKPGRATLVRFWGGNDRDMSIELRKSRRLLLFADYLSWSWYMSEHAALIPQLGQSALGYQIQNHSKRAVITIVALFPLYEGFIDVSPSHGVNWSMCAISWTTTPPTGAKAESCWKSMEHFSTLPYGWIPESGASFIALFIRYLKERWLARCAEAEEHLSQRRLDQLRAKGQSSKLVHHLAEDAREWSESRSVLRTQIRELKNLAAEHGRCYDSGRGPKILQEAIDDFDVEVNGAIKQLEQTVKDLLQFEFAWVSINEAHRSTSIATSIKRLSWITFIFLPAMFASSLFGMNVDILQNSPDWRWYLLFGGGFIALTFFAWLLIKYGQLERLVERSIGLRLQRLADRRKEPSQALPTLEMPKQDREGRI